MKNKGLMIFLVVIAIVGIFFLAGNFLAVTSIEDGGITASYADGRLNLFPEVPFVNLANSRIASQGCMIDGLTIAPLAIDCPGETSMDLEDGSYTAYYFVYVTSNDNCDGRTPYTFNPLSTQTSFDNNLCIANIPFQSSATYICSQNAIDGVCGIRVSLIDSTVYTSTFVVDNGETSPPDDEVIVVPDDGLVEVPWYVKVWNWIVAIFT